MNTSNLSRVISASIVAASLVASLAPAAALAQTPATASMNVGVHARLQANASSSPMHDERDHAERDGSSSPDHMGKITDKAGDAIDKRISDLQQISSRISSMKLLPEDDQAKIVASITAEISELTELKTKIAGDTDTDSMKADAQSITKAYRIYALVIPQDRIVSAADRVLAVAVQMQALSDKFADRISAAGSVDSSVANAKADFDAKVADSQDQASDVISLIANLQPDNGDASVRASNTAALKSASDKVKMAQGDLTAARKDANTIVKGVAGKPGNTTASTTANVSASAQ